MLYYSNVASFKGPQLTWNLRLPEILWNLGISTDFETNILYDILYIFGYKSVNSALRTPINS